MTLSEQQQLESIRKRIREITREIFKLFGQRLELARTIGNLKESGGLPPVDAGIERDLRKMVDEDCVRMGLDPAVGQRFLTEVFRETIRAELPTGKTIFKPIDPTLSDIVNQAADAEAKGLKIIHLELGEPDFEISAGIIERTIGAIRKGKSQYSDARGSHDLRDSIVRNVNDSYRVDFRRDNVLISPGARFAIFLAMASSLSWGDEVIIPAPSWGVYHQVAEYLGARIRTIKTDYKENWITRLTDIENTISPSTRMIVLNHPNNPTGKILDRQTLKSIAKLGIAKGITLLSDETYSEYAYVPYTSLLEFWEGKCITISSFSHTYSLSGFRIGYAISNPEIVNKMASLQRMMIRSVPEFIQEGAAEALASKEVLKENYLAMRDRVSEASALLNQYPVLFHKPDGGVYIFLKRRMESEKETFDSSEFSRRLLRQQGVAVSPGSIFGEKYSDFIRISLYQPKELLLEGIRRIGEALS